MTNLRLKLGPHQTGWGYVRQSILSTFYAGDLSLEEKAAISRSAGHCLHTALSSYVRKTIRWPEHLAAVVAADAAAAEEGAAAPAPPPPKRRGRPPRVPPGAAFVQVPTLIDPPIPAPVPAAAANVTAPIAAPTPAKKKRGRPPKHATAALVQVPTLVDAYTAAPEPVPPAVATPVAAPVATTAAAHKTQKKAARKKRHRLTDLDVDELDYDLGEEYVPPKGLKVAPRLAKRTRAQQPTILARGTGIAGVSPAWWRQVHVGANGLKRQRVG